MEIFCGITPGLERALEQEVRELAARPVKRVPGGVLLDGDLVDAAGLCLWSRLAGQVLVRVGTVQAASLQQLEQEARKLDWKGLLRPGPVKVKATVHRARFKRADAAAHKVGLALRSKLGGPRQGKPQEVLLRVEGRQATLSLDAGGRLHRRGYRQQTWKAPLRENLAAAVLWLADWTPDEPLLDPMCGAGTFGIEAALWGQAPGLHAGEPACVRWPGFPRGTWRELLDEARETSPVPARIWSSDRARGAIEAAEGNARRAGVLDQIHLRHLDLREVEPPVDPGLVVLNPPYGKRVAEHRKLHPIYGSIGKALRERFSGWRLAVVCPDRALAGRLLPKMEEVARFKNGGLPVTLFVGELP